MSVKRDQIGKTPAGETAGAESARSRVLQAAVEEFGARGFAGARMDAIARAAGVSKQLPFHYFKSKEILFQAAVLATLEQHKTDLEAWANGRDTLVQAEHVYSADPRLVRMLLWEGLELGDSSIQDQHGRVAIYREWIDGIRQDQASGRLDPALDPEHVVLSYLALTIFPYALPQITYLVTGLHTTDPSFAETRLRHLEALLNLLRPRQQPGRQPPKKRAPR
jgi:AcrR family transcriptional regulator